MVEVIRPNLSITGGIIHSPSGPVIQERPLTIVSGAFFKPLNGTHRTKRATIVRMYLFRDAERSQDPDEFSLCRLQVFMVMSFSGEQEPAFGVRDGEWLTVNLTTH